MQRKIVLRIAWTIVWTAASRGAPAAGAADTAAQAAKVVCRVIGAGKPLAGVLVSDGRRVARTDGDGRCPLAIGPDSGPFVFVTNPAGFWTEAFFVPAAKVAAAGRADFSLQAVEQPERFDFAFITDMHLENGEVGVRKFQMSLREINAAADVNHAVAATSSLCWQVAD